MIGGTYCCRRWIRKHPHLRHGKKSLAETNQASMGNVAHHMQFVDAGHFISRLMTERRHLSKPAPLRVVVLLPSPSQLSCQISCKCSKVLNSHNYCSMLDIIPYSLRLATFSSPIFLINKSRQRCHLLFSNSANHSVHFTLLLSLVSCEKVCKKKWDVA